MQEPNIRALYYITHIDNLSSILSQGILSHARVRTEGVQDTTIYNVDIINRRRNKYTPANKSLWHYANLYFQPRNAMMYRMVHQKHSDNLAVVGVNKKVLYEQGVVITDGNAANSQTQFHPISDGLEVLRKQWTVIQEEWWNNTGGSKRKMMSECLVPNDVRPGHIQEIYVAKNEKREVVREIIGNRNIAVSSEPNMFFQPNSRMRISDNISVIDGDMFFSTLQTLTISVNLQGIMGKGLASRAKYQFPDVYVAYQDVCRSKQITATKPYLYKREGSLDEELADFGADLTTPNAVKWFLLFAILKRIMERGLAVRGH